MFKRIFFGILAAVVMVGQTPTICPPQNYNDSFNCDFSITLNTLYWGGPFPVYVTNEAQVVSGAARAQFNLANCRDPQCYYFMVEVYHNGIRLTPDVQYGRNGYTVTLVSPAQPGDTMLFDYNFTWAPAVAAPPPGT